MNTIKNATVYILLAISVLGVLFSGIYFIVNVVEIPRQIKEIQYIKQLPREMQISSETHKEKNNIDNPGTIARIYGFFKSISIDLSAVTPFILLWFFAAISLNFYKTIKGKLTKEQLYEETDTLPIMPVTYEATWIQLGFIGTLWGFILIGLEMKNVSAVETTRILDILLKAFGTALLSTFTAVVMVYLIAPPFKGIWRWIHDISDIVIDPNIEPQLRILSGKLGETINTVGCLNKEIELLKNKISILSPNDILILLKNISNNMNNLVTKSEIDTVIKQRVEDNLKPIDTKISNIHDTLKVFSRESKDGFQHMEESIKNVGQNMQKVSRDIIEGVEQSTQKASRSIEESIRKDIQAGMESLVAGIKGTITTFENNIKDFIGDKLKITVNLPSFDAITRELGQIKGLIEYAIKKISVTKPERVSRPRGNIWSKITSSWRKR